MSMRRALEQGAKTRKKKAKDDDDCHAINAGFNSAIEEVMAEERWNRRLHAEEEFQAKIKIAVNRRHQLKQSMIKNSTVLHVSNHF